MEYIQVTFFAVLMMLAYACPGFILMKMKKLSEASLSPLVTVLLYICQPALTIVSFGKATALVKSGDITKGEMAIRCGIVVLLAFVMMIVVMGGVYFFTRKKQEDAAWRIFVIASVFGNCGFFGIPMLEAILPESPEVASYSAVFSLVMNAFSWTIGSAIITRDRRYISVKKAICNPNSLAAAVAILLFVFDVQFTGTVGNMLNVLAKFSSPLCMLILGMRLATVKPRELLGGGKQYGVILLKNVLFPLAVFGVVFLLPIDTALARTMVILCACPVANVVLSFAEMLGQGQKPAANMMLLSTIASILTLPLICCLLPLL